MLPATTVLRRGRFVPGPEEEVAMPEADRVRAEKAIQAAIDVLEDGREALTDVTLRQRLDDLAADLEASLDELRHS
jgi:hypothetical protein